MRPVSAAFLSTLRGSHTILVRARVLSTFQTGTGPTGTDIDVLGGKVILDATTAIRSTVDLATDGTGLWPHLAADLLAPYGNEVYVERGLQLGAGQEWCSLGYFRIQTPSQATPPDGPIRIVGNDRMSGIVDARLVSPQQFLATDTYGGVVTALITQVYPTATISWDDATDVEVLGRDLIVEEDRFAFLDDLIRSRGKIWYWDHRGILVILDPPDPGVSVWSVNAGADGVLVSMSRQLTRERVYNAVVASGESTDTQAPARAVAIDANPDSPTYFYGRFGPVPRFFSSAFLTTDAQALTAAEAILRTGLGLPYSVDFSTVPNPALEPYDPVTILPAVNTSPETHVLQSVTIPLDEQNGLTATTREQTTVLIGAI